MLEQLGAHHRRQGQRDDGGDEDGDGKRDGELAEEAADHIAHEEQRDEHCDERDGERDDGEADLLRAFERGGERVFAHFDVARDVLDHHDGVVDDEAGRDGERHQGEVVQAVPQQVHDAEGAHQRERHRDAGNDGGGKAAQEKEDHHHDQPDGQHQSELHIVYRGANGLGAICEYLNLDRRRQAHLELRQDGLDAVDHRDDVCAGLALHVHDDGRRAVHPRRLHGVFRAVDDIRHVGHADRRAVAIGNDDGLVVGGGQ